MSDPMITALVRLLGESLQSWRLDGEVCKNSQSDISLAASDAALLIARAPEGMPFRWVVTIDGRRRTAASVNGVLRIARQTLAPGYEPLSLRIAPLPSRSAQGAP